MRARLCCWLLALITLVGCGPALNGYYEIYDAEKNLVARLQLTPDRSVFGSWSGHAFRAYYKIEGDTLRMHGGTLTEDWMFRVEPDRIIRIDKDGKPMELAFKSGETITAYPAVFIKQ